ncbi:hypothetical protein BGZ58_009340 [Dissophora ornata]|nr:hypothetical protein BGZ58_009340 [Dissophora ornata]
MNNSEITTADAATSSTFTTTEHNAQNVQDSHEHHKNCQGHDHVHHDHVHHENENHDGHIHSPGHLTEHKSMVGKPIVEVAEQLGDSELPLFTVVPNFRK